MYVHIYCKQTRNSDRMKHRRKQGTHHRPERAKGKFFNMGRAKLPLKRITAEKNRNTTFKKRKKGLKKKVYEFATLCDVSACMICFGPEGQQFDTLTWPENAERVEEVMREYRSRGAEEQGKRRSSVVTYLTEQKKKAGEELHDWKRKNANLVYPPWDSQLETVSEDFLRQLARGLEMKLEIVDRLVAEIKGKQVVGREEMGGYASEYHQPADSTNYLLHMNHFKPVPISFIKPHSELGCSSIFCEACSTTRVPNFDYAKVNAVHHNFSMFQPLVNEEHLSYRKDYNIVNLGFLNQQALASEGLPSSSSSFPPLPGLFPQSVPVTVSGVQASGNHNFDDFFSERFSAGSSHCL